MRTSIRAIITSLFLFLFSQSVGADIIKIEFTKFDAYSKEIVHINSGDVVEWIPTNEGHNVELLMAPEIDFLPKKSKMNEFYSLIFEEPGIYVYGCTPHLNTGMLGLIVVNSDFHNIEHVNNLKLSPVAVSVLKRMLKKASSMSNAKNISKSRPPSQ